MSHLEDVVTLQGSWHVARCLARCKMLENITLSANDRVIIFGVGGWGGSCGWGGRRGETFVRHTQAHAACDTLLMLCSELFPVTF